MHSTDKGQLLAAAAAQSAAQLPPPVPGSGHTCRAGRLYRGPSPPAAGPRGGLGRAPLHHDVNFLCACCSTRLGVRQGAGGHRSNAGLRGIGEIVVPARGGDGQRRVVRARTHMSQRVAPLQHWPPFRPISHKDGRGKEKSPALTCRPPPLQFPVGNAEQITQQGNSRARHSLAARRLGNLLSKAGRHKLVLCMEDKAEEDSGRVQVGPSSGGGGSLAPSHPYPTPRARHICVCEEMAYAPLVPAPQSAQ